MSGFSSPLVRGMRVSVAIGVLLGLSACAEGQMPGFLKPKADTDRGEVVSRGSTGDGARSVERDVEAPDIFQATEAGLWDGRPSLGGVWVAHPDVKEPERAIIRNEQNGKFVIGALFKRERQSPGPRLQVSSDAAAALEVLAGQPSNLNVVALRREEIEETPDPAPLPGPVGTAAGDAAAMPAAPEVSEGTLDPVQASAARALDDATLAATAEASPAPAVTEVAAAALATPKPAARPAKAGSGLNKPFVQIGIFSVEQNARNTATAMRQAGMVPTVKTHSSQGKTFWRVVVGPAQTRDEMGHLLKTIKGSGFTDAYAVTD